MLLDFITVYATTGFVLSFIMNVLLWTYRQPPLSVIESLASTLLWPTVVTVWVNKLTDKDR